MQKANVIITEFIALDNEITAGTIIIDSRLKPIDKLWWSYVMRKKPTITEQEKIRQFAVFFYVTKITGQVKEASTYSNEPVS